MSLPGRVKKWVGSDRNGLGRASKLVRVLACSLVMHAKVAAWQAEAMTGAAGEPEKEKVRPMWGEGRRTGVWLRSWPNLFPLAQL
jgi:hypothetical protein